MLGTVEPGNTGSELQNYSDVSREARNLGFYVETPNFEELRNEILKTILPMLQAKQNKSVGQIQLAGLPFYELCTRFEVLQLESTTSSRWLINADSQGPHQKDSHLVGPLELQNLGFF